MATHILQQRFENFSNRVLSIALHALENGNDANNLEMHIEKLSNLLITYDHFRLFYNEETLNLKLEEINYVKDRIEQQLQFLNNNSIVTNRIFVNKKPTGGRPKFVVDIEAIKLLREQEFSWNKIAETFNISSTTLRVIERNTILKILFNHIQTFLIMS